MHRIPTIELMTSRRRKLLFSRSSRLKRLPPSLTSFRLYAKMQAKGGVKMQFPNFHEFEPYLRSIEHEVGQNASKLVIYQLPHRVFPVRFLFLHRAYHQSSNLRGHQRVQQWLSSFSLPDRISLFPSPR